MVAWLKMMWQAGLRALPKLGAHLLKHWLALFTGAACITILIVVFREGYLRLGQGWIWAAWADEKSFGGKTIWEWLELLIIPLFLFLSAFLLERLERDREWRLAKLRRKEDQEKAKDEQQNAALYSYIDKMTTLMLDPLHCLRNSGPDDEVRAIARTLTLTTLQGLDAVRKGSLLKFLYEGRLIGWTSILDVQGAITEVKGLPLIDLSEADLSRANLSAAKLHGACLRRVDLHEAELVQANLVEADLGLADMRGVDLRGAYLGQATLCAVDLRRAHLFGVDLTGTDLSDANLGGVSLCGVHLAGSTLVRVHLRKADLSKTDLQWANLCEANLSETDLRLADLRESNLSGANLSGSNVTNGQLSAARALDYAIMPDGMLFDQSIHTFWKKRPVIQRASKEK